MKRITTLLLLLSSVAFSYSQITFSTRLEAYNNLTGAKNHSTNVVWDDPDTELAKPKIGVGFMFEGLGIKSDSIVIGDGFIYFPSINGTEGLYLEATGTDLIDRGWGGSTALSPISSVTSGASGDRIFKIEFKNFGFFGEFEDSNSTKDFGNMQIWVYEKGGIIEAHYGNISVTSKSPYSGLSGFYVFAGRLNLLNQKLIGIALDGDQANPQINTMNNSLVKGILVGHPELGRVYKFAIPASVSIETAISQRINVYPQPVNQLLHIELDVQKETTYFSIQNIAGELMADGIIENNTIDVSQLSQGLYILRVEQDGRQYHTKFQKI